MTAFPVGERCSSTVVGGHHHGAEATDNQKERERGPGREGWWNPRGSRRWLTEGQFIRSSHLNTVWTIPVKTLWAPQSP